MSYDDAIIIGKWHEPDPREFSHCPSYYAADYEVLRVRPGVYPARLKFVTGYMVPMPYWLLIGIECERIDGRLYSGFGGVNFSSTELLKGETVKHTIQSNSYLIGEYVDRGMLALAPHFAWLTHKPAFRHPSAPTSWEMVRALREIPTGFDLE